MDGHEKIFRLFAKTALQVKHNARNLDSCLHQVNIKWFSGVKAMSIGIIQVVNIERTDTVITGG